MSAPILEVSTRGQTRFIPGDPTPAQTTALAKIDPDAVVRDALDRQSSTVQAYLKAVGNAAQRTVDATPQRAPQGYSNDSELKARNTRFFVTVGAFVAISATISAGIVWIAALADVIEGSWQMPAWLTLAGGLALGLVWATHRSEAERTPEGIELERVRSDGYAVERQADGQHAIALAVAQAIGFKAESEFADSQARQLATDAMYASMRSAAPAPQTPQRQITDNRRFAVKWQGEPENGDMVYATSLPIDTLQTATAQPTRRIVCTPMAPDAACLAMLDIVGKLFDDCAQRGDSLITTRLPWSQRGDWVAPMKRQATEVLAQLDPPLFVAGDGGRWRLNVGAWVKPLALSAIKRKWPH